MTIYKPINYLALLLIMSVLFSCSSIYNGNSVEPLQWDFDHKVQFRKIQLDEYNYHLEIMPNDKVKFDSLAALLIRYSYEICRGYNYKIKVLSGVELFTEKMSSPNYILGALIADVECSTKEKT